MSIVELPMIGAALQTWRDISTGGIFALFEFIADAFSWLEDDHLADGILVLEGERLVPGEPTGAQSAEACIGLEGGRRVACVMGLEETATQGRLHLRGGDTDYSHGWWPDNREYPHVRLVLTDLYSHDCDCDDYSDEPYVVLAGFSVFPEGGVTWVPEPIPPVGDDVDANDDDEDFPQIVVFDGEASEDYTIGFVAWLFEDDGGYIGYGTRHGMAQDIAEELQARLGGESATDECGQTRPHSIAEFEVNEDGNGGGVHRFPACNVGEPGPLWFDSLTPFGFPGERLAGILCSGHWCESSGCPSGETCPTGTGFCGSENCGYRCNLDLSWDFTCATPVLELLESDEHWKFAFDDLARR